MIDTRASLAVGALLFSLMAVPAIAAQGAHRTDFPSATDVNGTFCNARISAFRSHLAGDELSAVQNFLSTSGTKFIIFGMRREYYMAGTISANRYTFFYDWTAPDGEHYEPLLSNAGSYIGQQVSFQVQRSTNPGVSPASWALTLWTPNGNYSNALPVTTNETYLTNSMYYSKNLSGTCSPSKLKSDVWYYLGRNDAGNWWYAWNSTNNSFNDTCPLYGKATGSISSNSTGTVWFDN